MTAQEYFEKYEDLIRAELDIIEYVSKEEYEEVCRVDTEKIISDFNKELAGVTAETFVSTMLSINNKYNEFVALINSKIAGNRYEILTKDGFINLYFMIMPEMKVYF